MSAPLPAPAQDDQHRSDPPHPHPTTIPSIRLLGASRLSPPFCLQRRRLGRLDRQLSPDWTSSRARGPKSRLAGAYALSHYVAELPRQLKALAAQHRDMQCMHDDTGGEDHASSMGPASFQQPCRPPCDGSPSFSSAGPHWTRTLGLSPCVSPRFTCLRCIAAQKGAITGP